MDYWYKENTKNIYSLFWILNLTNMCICIYCVRVNETCKFKMALNIKSSISWIHKQTSYRYFFISLDKEYYIFLALLISTQRHGGPKESLCKYFYIRQLPLEQCTGCIVGKTLLIHRTVKTIGLMNPCLDEELVMPYTANPYKHHKKIKIILLWWQHLWASTGS